MLKLTGPMLILFLTAVFLFLAATNIQIGWVYLVDALLWSVVLMAFVLPLLQLRRLRIQRRFSASAYCGQPLQVEIEVTHTGRWPLAFINLEDLPPQGLRGGSHGDDSRKGFIVSLARGQTFRYSYSLIPEREGVYVFERLRTGSFGPLGLVGIYRAQQWRSAVVVRPLAPEVSPPLMSEDQQLALRHARRRSHHSEDISHFREYQPGDNKRAIHWKNSAKRQRLIVAEAREEPFQQALLLVDTWQQQPQAGLDACWRKATELCHALLEQQMELHCFAQAADGRSWEALELPAPERSLPQVRDWEHAGYWLATLAADAPEALDEALARQGLNVGEQLVVLISARPSARLLARLCAGRGTDGLAPILVYTDADTPIPPDLRPLISLRPLS